MKTTLYTLILMLFIFSCSSNDDAQQTAEPTLNGSWNLVNVFGGFAGVDDNFETGVIIWKFNDTDAKITVTNTNTNDVIHSGYATGSYNYEVIITANDSTLIIENRELKIITLSSTQLIIDEGYVSDGFQYTFSR